MNPFDQAFPRYLSADSERELFSEIDKFPSNIDEKLYTTYLDNDPDILQGDGLASVCVIDLPNPEIKYGPVIVLSNSCDITGENKRYFPVRVMYCPIVKLSAYANSIRKRGLLSDESLASHLEAIKKQRISSYFFLPANQNLKEECIAILDRTNNCLLSHIRERSENLKKLFILSDYGFYLFLIKLSIHFTRVREDIERKMPNSSVEE